MRVWIDQELCTGDGQCVDICPAVFVMREDGRTYRAYVREDDRRGDAVVVPRQLERDVVEAAEDCPGSCIFVDHGE